jgi:uncharacterized membrane protein
MVKGWDQARLVASLAGIAVSGYLTVQHYDRAVSLACPANGAVNCERVLASPQALWLGIPVALWGAVWFVVAAALAGASLARPAPGEPAWLRQAGLAWTAIGAAVVIGLVYTELAVVGAICLWCSIVHGLVVGLFVLQVLTDSVRTAGDNRFS